MSPGALGQSKKSIEKKVFANINPRAEIPGGWMGLELTEVNVAGRKNIVTKAINFIKLPSFWASLETSKLLWAISWFVLRVSWLAQRGELVTP